MYVLTQNAVRHQELPQEALEQPVRKRDGQILCCPYEPRWGCGGKQREEKKMAEKRIKIDERRRRDKKAKKNKRKKKK